MGYILGHPVCMWQCLRISSSHHRIVQPMLLFTEAEDDQVFYHTELLAATKRIQDNTVSLGLRRMYSAS